MGGNVALEFAARYPEIPDSILMIDSVLFSNPEFRKFLRDVMEGLLTSDYVVACQNALHATCFPSDEEPMKEEVLGLTTPNVKNRTLRFWGSMVPSKRMA